jgi:repressor LexA
MMFDSGETPSLTPRQREILALIERSVREQGAPPTRAEIAATFGFKSPNAAEEHLRALARKGVIELVGGTSRGIRLRRPERSTRQTGLPGMEQLLLPLVGRVAAGSPILAQAHVETSYPVDPHLFQRRPDYLLRVRGLSMRDDGILEGDLLAVHATREARDGQTVVARLGDDVTVKRLQRRPGGVRLCAANPDFADIEVRAGEPFEIEGVVVGLLRRDGWA